MQAAEIALNGVVQEEQVGSRTILDVLDAELELLELLDTRSNLVVATRNEVVANLELCQVDRHADRACPGPAGYALRS